MNARAYVHFLLTEGRVFVYGTLMRGEEAHAEMRGARFLGVTRTLPRYHLKVLGDDFEAIVPGGREAISGELYQVSFGKLCELDDWEYDIYVREYIHIEDGGVCDAYVLRSSFPLSER